MSEHAVHEFSSIGLFLVGTCLPLILTAMVPNGLQRMGSAVLALLGIGVLIGLLRAGSTPLHAGLATGFILASIKLLTGLRFL